MAKPDRITPLRDLIDNPLLGLDNTEVEQALLGALLVNNKAFDHVEGIVVETDFANGIHGRIFAAISTMIVQGVEANAVSLKHFLADSLGQIGGVNYLVRLVESAVSVLNAPNYARTIADLARRREIVTAAADIRADAANIDPERDADTVIDDAEQLLYEIAKRSAAKRTKPRGIGDVAGPVVTEIEESYKRGGAVVVDTGIAGLDGIISGMGAGDLVVLAARPSIGKSALAGTVAMNAARIGNSVAMFSLEMTSEELAQRWLAGLSGVDTDRQRHGRVQPDEWEKLTEAARFLSTLRITIDDQPRLSVAQIRQRARRIKRRLGLDLIVIDHLQLIRQGGKQESRRLEIGDATSMLKATAKEIGVPILLLSQLSRAVEQRDDKRPMLSDLRESGDIEQDADIVMFLYREEYYLSRIRLNKRANESEAEYNSRLADHEERVCAARGLAEISVLKNRHGRIGTIEAVWLPERQRFEGIAR